MAAIAKSGTPSVSSVDVPQAHEIVGLLAGEAIAAGDPCYIKAADGKVWLSTGAAVAAAAKVRGWAGFAAAAGEAVTLYTDVNIRYGAGMTPGADVFLGATAAALSDVATTGGTAPIGYVIDATRIRVWASRY